MLYGAQDAAMQRNFIEESNAPENQKRIEHQKLNALLGLCEAANCRRQIILKYLGDECAPCNNCDTCMEPPVTFDGTIAAQKAISAVYRTGQRFGIAYLTDILRGQNDERVQKFKHDQLSVFNIGNEYGKQEWQNIFRQLIAQNLLSVEAEHGGLKITQQGMEFLKKKNVISLRKYTAKTKTKKAKFAKAVEFTGDIDNELYLALKAMRLNLAKEQNLPPYVIFHDKTLRDLVVLKPTSLEAMSHVSGVSQVKIERYGKIFLDAINKAS